MIEGRESGRLLPPSEQAVTELIERAERHPGGTRLLLDGAHDAVAATFGVHAFVVDAARARLAGREITPVGTDRFVPRR
jgi:hypothetical protein